jgi:tetratricopeptide (TPR) repeat protein
MFVVLLFPVTAGGQAVPAGGASLARADSLAMRARAVIRNDYRDRTGTSLPDSVRRLEAIFLWREALPIYRAERFPRRVLDALMGIASNFLFLRERDSTLAYYRHALTASREVGDRNGEIETRAQLARAHELFFHYDSALTHLRQVLGSWRSLKAHPEEATTLSDIVRVHRMMTHLDSAVVYARQNLSLRQELDRPTSAAAAYVELGILYDDWGQADSAASYYREGLRLYREAGHEQLEASTLGRLGDLYRKTGRPDSALALYDRELAIHRKRGDERGITVSRVKIAEVHQFLGRRDSVVRPSVVRPSVAYVPPPKDSTRDRLRREQARARADGNWRGEAQALSAFGGFERDNGRADSAIVYMLQALSIHRAREYRRGVADMLGAIAFTYSRQRNPDSALAYYTRALPIWQELRLSENEATSLTNIGDLHSTAQRVDSAIAYWRRAAVVNRKSGNRASEAAAFVKIGSAHLEVAERTPALREGRARTAAANFDSAAALYSTIRRNAGGDANAVSFAETSTDVFARWSYTWRVVASHARGTNDAATRHATASSLGAAERGRAQALRDLLERRRDDPAVAPASDMSPGADLGGEIGQLLQPLRSARTAMLYYQTDSGVTSWFLAPGGELHVLTVSRQPNSLYSGRIVAMREQIGVDDAAIRSRRGTPERGLGTKRARSDDAREVVAALRGLSGMVLPAGLDTLLPAGTELVIVPHGTLGQVPFAALTLARDTVPLGVRNPLRYAPSLRALQAASTKPPAGRLRNAVVVGNPTMPRVRDDTGSEHQLAALPGAFEEGRWVADRLGAQLLTGNAATESFVRRRLANASIVHLATHGLAYGSETRVRDSYVALAPEAGHDGLLTLGELLDDDTLRLTADLIVLSACQTGLGETRQAEGTVGLQRGLLAKGARSVIVSLWSVDDAATTLLMQRFYTHWLGRDGAPEVSKAEALRRAQRDLRADPRYSHPKFWAAFQLVGAN